MKKQILLTLIIVASLASCSKFKKNDCSKLEGYHKFIYHPIVIDANCNCIVEGKVKYVKDCETIALVDYGDGSCDKIATKIICVDGKCEPPFAKTIEFKIDCNKPIHEGPVQDEEINSLLSVSP